MEKNYYDILEINKNASQEIVEKAYKTLAKKYHPDLQDDILKKDAEIKMKEINEAYNIISNPDKRKLYDEELKKDEALKKIAEYNSYQKNIENIKKQNQNYMQTELDNLKKQNEEYNRKKQEELYRFEQEKKQAIQKAYYDAYIQDLKSRGYKIRYKKTLKDYFRIFITIR